MEELEKSLGYKFKEIKYLKTGLTHSSYANENKKNNVKCNERQEFLGDAVLSIVVSDYIYKNCPNLPEGDLTKLRASLVCEKSLAGYARSIHLGKFLLLSKGERRSNGQDRPSILADAFESVIAAIYLDAGMEENARKSCARTLEQGIPCPCPIFCGALLAAGGVRLRSCLPCEIHGHCLPDGEAAGRRPLPHRTAIFQGDREQYRQCGSHSGCRLCPSCIHR